LLISVVLKSDELESAMNMLMRAQRAQNDVLVQYTVTKIMTSVLEGIKYLDPKRVENLLKMAIHKIDIDNSAKNKIFRSRIEDISGWNDYFEIDELNSEYCIYNKDALTRARIEAKNNGDESAREEMVNIGNKMLGFSISDKNIIYALSHLNSRAVQDTAFELLLNEEVSEGNVEKIQLLIKTFTQHYNMYGIPEDQRVKMIDYFKRQLSEATSCRVRIWLFEGFYHIVDKSHYDISVQINMMIEATTTLAPVLTKFELRRLEIFDRQKRKDELSEDEQIRLEAELAEVSDELKTGLNEFHPRTIPTDPAYLLFYKLIYNTR